MKISAASQRRASSRQFTGASDLPGHVCAAIRESVAASEPWLHWRISAMFTPEVLRDLRELSLMPDPAGRRSGRREYGNSSRVYFDRGNIARYPIMRSTAEALQSPAVVSTICESLSARLERTFLRIEYALDTDGFWLEPHTDIGAKKFTCFLYLDGADDLGTDIYADAQTLSYRLPFIPNTALAFGPNGNTWHGFAPRPIRGVRRSLIINYVGAEWRAREQLAFPDMPVRAAR
jgi:hypothetical protein